MRFSGEQTSQCGLAIGLGRGRGEGYLLCAHSLVHCPTPFFDEHFSPEQCHQKRCNAKPDKLRFGPINSDCSLCPLWNCVPGVLVDCAPSKNCLAVPTKSLDNFRSSNTYVMALRLSFIVANYTIFSSTIRTRCCCFPPNCLRFTLLSILRDWANSRTLDAIYPQHVQQVQQVTFIKQTE